ncbi:MAG: enoyl-CoA hydratase/isomerase family protein [Coriobacteriaceae bacterium]|jgi:2-(1,2-epoxy-1,2-dihydrophenyl)acetyl-CoA isomerase|nr:enoyl-CoA hydratase/isomerase family protein [Coriobacteriaceae bacterium]
MIDEILISKQEGGVATITLNRPEKKNALTVPMWLELSRAFHECNLDDEVRCIVIRGAGGNFSAGGDLSAAVDPDAKKPEPGEVLELSRAAFYRCSEVARTMQRIEKPIIALVEGWAIGGAFSIALSADLIYCSETAKFRGNFLHLGRTPELGAFVYLPLAIGAYKAKELWFAGKDITGAQAQELGFVNHVLPEGEAEKEAYAMAATIAELPAVCVRVTKRMVNSSYFDKLDMVLSAETQNQPFVGNCEESRQFLMKNFRKKS